MTDRGGVADAPGALSASDLGLIADPEVLAAAVLACPSVAGLSGGRLGDVATYLPGRRVVGVRVPADGPAPEVVVNVVGRYGPTIAEIAAEVTAAVRAIAGPVAVHVGVDDLALP